LPASSKRLETDKLLSSFVSFVKWVFALFEDKIDWNVPKVVWFNKKALIKAFLNRQKIRNTL